MTDFGQAWQWLKEGKRVRLPEMRDAYLLLERLGAKQWRLTIGWHHVPMRRVYPLDGDDLAREDWELVP